MNYLAHAYFSNNNKDLLLGNFIADHIKGNRFENLPESIVEGIKLHRKIDHFTDTNIHFITSKRFFNTGFSRYSGILCDIYLDHYLAKHFGEYSSVSLFTFAQNTYNVYEENKNLLSTGAHRFLNYVLSNNIYTAYSSLEGIEKVLFHLSHRINHGIELHQSLSLYTHNQENIEHCFSELLKEATTEFGINR